MKAPSGVTLAMLGLALLILFGGQVGGCPLPDVTTDKPVAGTYFYEQRLGDPPPPVSKAIATLNKIDGFIATQEDVDVIAKSGAVPKQYELTLPEAKKLGIPSWVTRSKTRVLKSVKNPQTEKDILETAP